DGHHRRVRLRLCQCRAVGVRQLTMRMLTEVEDVSEFDQSEEQEPTGRSGAEDEQAAAAEEAGTESAEPDPVAELREKLRFAPGDWYVVHSYAGYENKVKANLETRITSLDMEDHIFQVEVPTRP